MMHRTELQHFQASVIKKAAGLARLLDQFEDMWAEVQQPARPTYAVETTQ